MKHKHLSKKKQNYYHYLPSHGCASSSWNLSPENLSYTTLYKQACKMSEGEQSETTAKRIKYETYRSWPQNPTYSDYLTFLPLNIAHYFSNLSNAFGWKFVTLVGSVYGIQQGNLSMRPLDLT